MLHSLPPVPVCARSREQWPKQFSHLIEPTESREVTTETNLRSKTDFARDNARHRQSPHQPVDCFGMMTAHLPKWSGGHSQSQHGSRVADTCQPSQCRSNVVVLYFDRSQPPEVRQHRDRTSAESLNQSQTPIG